VRVRRRHAASRITSVLIASALLSAATASAASPLRGMRYTGTTDQGQSLGFGVTRSGKEIVDMLLPLRGSCSDGDSFGTNFRQGEIRIRISRAGRFLGQGTVHGATGVIVSGTVKVSGRFTDHGRRARGVARELASINDGSTCETGDVTFRARARRRSR
jgi:hypothetical protein